jgi:hypothetical protein
MSRTFKIFLLFALPIGLMAFATNAFRSTRAAVELALTAPQPTPQTPNARRVRNLSLQQEAFNLSRRLGSRFVGSRRAASVLTGNLTNGPDRQTVTVVRRQTDSGETVEILLGLRSVTWSEGNGITARSGAATDAERLLVERLTFDSADQFVLAQLRGASYRIIDRNVRADAGGTDDYRGPLWNVVQVEDPETDDARKLLSSLRLYYINVQTGLLDKIVTEFQGERIEANLLEWIEQTGEKFPSRIVWMRGEQMLMEFRVATFTHQRQQ